MPWQNSLYYKTSVAVRPEPVEGLNQSLPIEHRLCP